MKALPAGGAAELEPEDYRPDISPEGSKGRRRRPRARVKKRSALRKRKYAFKL